MLQRSPIIRFALEVMEHALECYCSDKSRDKKIAVLNLAQCVELSVKAALVENNVSIYEKGSRTLNIHDALQSLSKVWKVDKIDNQARAELLIDERNAIQHRYGTVDDITLDYHMQTAFDVVSDILRREFDTELGDWIRDTVDKGIWEKVRFVAGEEETQQTPSTAINAGRSPALDFVEGFSIYERNVRELIFSASGKTEFNGSTLDIVMKTLVNSESTPKELIKDIPAAYKLRNKVIHGRGEAVEDEVKVSLSVLDDTLKALRASPDGILLKAIKASEAGVRGTALPDSDAPTVANAAGEA
ncbi:hypothetical protein [Azospirillum brasilense]|uniref:hypothetical protein n=1 Tax=Azospirillum brasilense TaxID=192 RepID=UPI0011C49469|nr:hypothetical protein [Azospirillum brasilense]NUB24698.1 hypothetical protein [Azospirillum brasilense]NUB30698.1 hypothetical protein [Azospirillum brasilense]